MPFITTNEMLAAQQSAFASRARRIKDFDLIVQAYVQLCFSHQAAMYEFEKTSPCMAWGLLGDDLNPSIIRAYLRSNEYRALKAKLKQSGWRFILKHQGETNCMVHITHQKWV